MNIAGEADEWLSFLGRESFSGDPGVGGFDLRLWRDSTWILHAMYDSLSQLPDWWSPEDSEAFSRFERPDIPGVERVAWASAIRRNYRGQDSALVERIGFAPSMDWVFPEGFAVGQIPPPEGVLDEISFEALLEILAHHSPTGSRSPILAFYSNAALGCNGNRGRMFKGDLSELAEFVREPGMAGMTPNNFWSQDRSWFVWTDYDLVATKVSGSKGLIDAIRNSESIEHFDDAQQ